MPMGMPEWDGTPESAREINCAFNAVLDVLVNAGMWTGDPPYRGKNAAEQVRMLVQRATTGSQLATDILAALGDANARAEAAEAQGYDIAASAALETQNLREELTAMRQRAEAAEAALAIADQRGWHKEAQETLAVNMQLGLQIDQLRAELAATTARAEAEAQLATDRGKAIAAANASAEEASRFAVLNAQRAGDMERRAKAAEAKLAAARADLDLTCGYLDAVTNGLSVKELAQLADVAAEVRQRWGLDT